MFIIGLTGSVAMGKSETVKMLRILKAPVFDADLEVRRILKIKSIIKKIQKRHPEVIIKGEIDRLKLAKIVFKEKRELLFLESIIHPILKTKKNMWLRSMIRKRKKFVFFDIPLLLERQYHNKYDFVIVVSADYNIQKKRALSRKGWNEKKFESVLNKQLPDTMKRKKANLVIRTDRGKRYVFTLIKGFVKQDIEKIHRRPISLILREYT